MVGHERRVENPVWKLGVVRFAVTEDAAFPQDGMRIAFTRNNPSHTLENPQLYFIRGDMHVDVARSSLYRGQRRRHVERFGAFGSRAPEVDELFFRCFWVDSEAKGVVLVAGPDRKCRR